MNNFRFKLLIGIAILMVVIAVIYVFVFARDKETPAQYPQSVQNAIDHPVEKIQDWSTLVQRDDFEISYSKSGSADSFFITVNAQPVVAVSEQAEQAFLEKLGVDTEYACSLSVIIKVPSGVDENLAGYNFGMSFCPDRVHVSDLARQ